jgi:Ca2+-binding EF-hand superfamily protein
LFLLVASIEGSLGILVWTTVTLIFSQMLAALLISQCFQGYFADESIPLESRLRLYRYFGTFLSTSLSMFELSIGNYAPICNTVADDIGQGAALLIVLYKVVVGFGVVKVMTGVFMQQVNKAATQNIDIAVLEKDRQSARMTENFREVFAEIDSSGDGNVNLEEFRNVIQDHRVTTWLKALEFDVAACENIFSLLDDGDGVISFDEFLGGIRKLKGTAKSLDVVVMGKQQIHLIAELAALDLAVKSELQRFGDLLYTISCGSLSHDKTRCLNTKLPDAELQGK